MAQINRFPNVEPKEAMNWSYNITAYTMIRNIKGSSVEFGGTLRRLAYRSHLQNRPLRVLEATYGIPSIALELLNPRSFRSKGDFLKYYNGSSDLDDITAASSGWDTEVKKGFETPEIQITTVSPKDYILDFLLGNNHGFEGSSTLQKRMSAIFYREGQDYRRASKDTLRQNYEEAQSEGRVSVHEGDIVSQMESLSREGERYDLVVFNQLMYSEDRVQTLEALQSVISVGGVAYVPLTWWSPRFGRGIHKGTLLADKVHFDGQDSPLEGYLSQNYPDAFEVRQFPSVKTLIVKGTQNPIKLPSMRAEIVKPHVSVYSENHPDYYPDMPVMRWTLE